MTLYLCTETVTISSRGPGGCHLRVGNKKVPIEILYKIGQMLHILFLRTNCGILGQKLCFFELTSFYIDHIEKLRKRSSDWPLT